jgi:predicted RNase H-like nuclease (RuvC/YqgF family)|tara:strand:- start:1129 stop:1569 length:441 start_codon:yes stop_codon:yes gene_type:complete
MVEQKNNNNNTAIKVQIESLKKDIENISTLNSRIDNAIEKLTDVSASIKSMLAVHEEKISRQELIDEVIFKKITERKEDIETVHKELTRELEQVEKRLLLEIKAIRNDIGSRVGMLEKYRWLIMGGAIVIGWFIAINGHEILEMMK